MLVALPALAEIGSIRIDGRAAVTVAKQRITLADIADVYSPQASDDEAIIALRSIRIGAAPNPGGIKELTANEILSVLTAAQVDLSKVGYKLPQQIVVTRAARSVSEGELRASIEQAFAAQGREVIVHSVDVTDPFLVEPGPITLEAAIMPSTSRGRAPLLVTAKGESSEIRSKVIAAIEEWREVPVAARSLGRGAIVGPNDVVMARLQSHLLPADAASKVSSVIGFALQSGISSGEAFAGQKLFIPPVVTAGSKVTMLVRNGGLEATASGIAIESGAADQRITIRNEASKKLVTGKVLEPGLVLIEEGLR
jgi:flagella basal body P-ring formation protein FlgA